MNRQDPLRSNKIVPATDATNTNNNLENNANSKPTVWLDKQLVRQKLNISSRTLQNWRSKGILPFHRVKGKIYYSEDDIEQMLMVRREKK